MEKIQFCYIHSSKPAKRHCRKCSVSTCNDCAIEKHSDHIDEVVRLANSGDNVCSSLIKSFMSKSKPKITNATCPFNSQAHAQNSFCCSCNLFYCGQCESSTHSSHLSESLNNLSPQLFDVLKLLVNVNGNEKTKFTNINSKDLVSKVTSFENDMKNIITSITKAIDVIAQRNKDIENIIDNNKRSFKKVVNTYQGMKDIDNVQLLYDKVSYGNNLQKVCDIFNNYKTQFENAFNNDEEINKFATLITNINNLKEITNESNLKLIALIYSSLNNFKHNEINAGINKNITEYHKDTRELVNEINANHFTYSAPQSINNTNHVTQFKHLSKALPNKAPTPPSQAVKTGHDVNKLKQIFEKNSQSTSSSSSNISLSKKNTTTISASSSSISIPHHAASSSRQEESNVIKSRAPGTPLNSTYIINPGNVKEQITRNVDMFNRAEEKNARTSGEQVKVHVTKPNCYQNAPTKLSTPFDKARSVFDTGVAMNVHNVGPLASMTNTIQQSKKVKHIPTMMEEISKPEKNNQPYKSESASIIDNKPQQETSNIVGLQKSYSISETRNVNSIKNIFEQGELRNKEQKKEIEKKTSYTYNNKELH